MQGKYLDSTMKRFVKFYNSGTTVKDAETKDMGSYSMGIIPPLVAMYTSQPDLLKHVESAVSLFQVRGRGSQKNLN